MDIKIFANIIEEEAISQIENISKLFFFENEKIRIMPDTHAGKGCVIGFTSTIGNYIVPSLVGVDIACGMLTAELGNVDINFDKLDMIIRNHVPSGNSIHASNMLDTSFLKKLKCFDKLKNINRIEKSIGTLGGGNHFIEIDKDKDDRKYLIIHTGSRNLGKQVAEHYQNLAYSELKKERNCIEITKDISYLTGKFKEDYLHDMGICQYYSSLNRRKIADEILSNLEIYPINIFETLHNYIDLDNMIVRKGAIDASKDKKLIIPVNMRDGCIIGIGKGNEDWNFSAPHGAGRLMSRNKAKNTFNIEEYKNSMNGIYSTTINENNIDEIAMAYKPIESIISMITDTIDVVDIIKPVYNYKA